MITVTIDGDNNVITGVLIDFTMCIDEILEASSTGDANIKDMLNVNEAMVTLVFSDFDKTKVELPDEIKDADDSDDSDDKKDEEETTPDKDDVKPSKKDDKKDDSDVSEKANMKLRITTEM